MPAAEAEPGTEDVQLRLRGTTVRSSVLVPATGNGSQRLFPPTTPAVEQGAGPADEQPLAAPCWAPLPVPRGAKYVVEARWAKISAKLEKQRRRELEEREARRQLGALRLAA